jgi:predicted metalloendopeptidase
MASLRSFVRAFGAFSLAGALAAAPLHAVRAVVDSPSGVARENFDPSVPPSTDFYRFVNGGWLARHPVPPDRSYFGVDTEVQQRDDVRLNAILQSPQVTEAPAGSERRKLGDYYAACTDLRGIERSGTQALQPAFAQIAALSSPRGLAVLAAAGARLRSPDDGAAPLFAFYSEQDPSDATHVIASLSQGGTALSSRNYYLGSDAGSRRVRAAYVESLRATFRLLGDDAPTAAAEEKAVLDIETRIARAQRTPEALRDPQANVHVMSPAQLSALAPHFAWNAYLHGVGLSPERSAKIDVGQPEAIAALDPLIVHEPLSAWKSYLRWHAIFDRGAALPQRFERVQFAFDRVLEGTLAEPPRSRLCTSAANRVLGFALGHIFVERFFSPAARSRARAEVAAIVAALHDDLETLEWMSPPSRSAALAKLAKLDTSKVGYPDRWRDYSGLHVERDDFLADVLAAAQFQFDREIAKIGKPVDRSDWDFPPQTVDASYDPGLNQITIPAGILQPPFFDAGADDAVNFGGIGAVVGHELTHGYDDEGSQYDGDGNLRAWLAPADAKEFHARIACIVKQADDYQVAPGLHLNGKLVVGEATADLGGTVLALRALENSERSAPTPAPIDGYTPVQRFFLGYAASWRASERAEFERNQVLSDPHPVPRYRTDATVSDMDDFYAAFAVDPGTPMYRAPADRCRIW